MLLLVDSCLVDSCFVGCRLIMRLDGDGWMLDVDVVVELVDGWAAGSIPSYKIRRNQK